MARIPSGMRKKANGLFEKRFTVDGKRYSAYGHNVKECTENETLMREEIKAGLYTSNRNITLRLWLYFPVNRRFYRLETVKFSLFATDLPPTK